MTKFVKTIALVTLMVSGLAIGANAQTSNRADSVKHARKEAHQKFKASLTPQQQAALKANHESRKAARKQFVGTLTADQKAIIKDKALSPKERKQKLAATLTPEQKEVVATNKEQRKTAHKAFLATLTNEQKAQMKDMAKGRRANAGFRHHKMEKAS